MRNLAAILLLSMLALSGCANPNEAPTPPAAPAQPEAPALLIFQTPLADHSLSLIHI